MDFKRADNVGADASQSWFTPGDAAPNRRFSFRYQTWARFFAWLPLASQ